MEHALFFGTLGVLAFLFAKVEIEIEGGDGWAAKLPTWRLQNRLTDLLYGGRPLTGYHLWLTLFLIGMFHLPLAFAGFSAALWAKCLSSYLLVTAAWDLQWFVWNPAWGFDALRAREVPWFRRKLLGLPVDYFMGYAVSGVATALIWSPGLEMWAGRTLAVLLLSVLSVLAAKI